MLGGGPAAAQPSEAAATKVAGRTLIVRVLGKLPPVTARIRVKGPNGYVKRLKVRKRLKLSKLEPGMYRIRTKAVRTESTRYVPTKDYLRARVTKDRGARFKLRYQRIALGMPAIAPESPPPAGTVSELLDRINRARAAGERCDGTTGAANQRIGYSAELTRMAGWYLEDVLADRQTDDLEDYDRSGFVGSYLAQAAVYVPAGSDATAVYSEASKDDFTCSYLLRADVDRIGIATAPGGTDTDGWALTFGISTEE